VVNEAISAGGLLSLDCEWEGDYPDFPGAFIRAVQFRIRYDNEMPERTYILKLAEESTAFAEVPGFSDQIAVKVPTWSVVNEKIVIAYLKELLESPRISIIGQNVREDGKWLLMLHGIDIRPNTLYDTMLAEHCINSMGPFGLEVLTCKYTTIGRYDTDVEQWKLANANKCERGYASIPDSILLPYAAFDVVAPLLIMDAQIPKLAMYMRPRGEYPSVFEGDMGIANLLYELEATGMLVDPVQLGKLTTVYHDKRRELLKPVQEKVFERYLISNFNPGSHKQMADLLFSKMKLAPIKTTGKPSKDWGWVQRQRPEIQDKYSPSTDGDTLEILATNGDDLLQDLLDYGKVSTICKNFLRNDKQGGIPGNTHPDGRLHARFSQLSETARFKHSDPNVANFPKAAEGDLGKIICKGQEEHLCELLGKDKKGKPIIGVRSVVVADEGCVFVEGDFKQAELVTLGMLAEDPVYMSLLNTPGKDLHDRTTIDSFRLKVYHYDGSEYSMDEMSTIAVSDKELYEWMMNQLVYVRPNGEKLTRAEFRDTLRVAGKAIGFGINYGRGSKALQLQVRAEIGLNLEVDLFQQGIDAWHNTYRRASAFLERHGNYGVDRGYAENPFGRRRVFAPPGTEEEAAAIRRESGNAIIQSTVADALILGMLAVERERKKAGLSFKIVNPIHDALMLLVPENEAKEAASLLSACLSSIVIPGLDGSPPFHLDVDISTFKRWGVKQ